MRHEIETKQTETDKALRYRAVCACGWKGGGYSNLGNAMHDGDGHLATIRQIEGIPEPSDND